MIKNFLAVAIPVGFLLAQDAPMKNDPKRPVDKISHDLKVKPDQFAACFSKVTPAREGSRPTPEQKRANKAVLLSCLKKANPEITNEKLDAVMDKYRPGGHEAQ